MLEKKELPLLEFDAFSREMIDTHWEAREGCLPEKCLFLFLSEEKINEFLKENHAEPVVSFESITKTFTAYTIDTGKEKIAVCHAPAGAPAAGMVMELLIGCGVTHILACGSCGSLEEIEENAFVLVEKALRDEGTSCHYLPASRFVLADEAYNAKLEEALQRKGYHYQKGTTWTTDAFFRETQDKVQLRKEEGCCVVDMECSALLAIAKHRNVKYAQLLFTADSLADLDNYDIRGFGKSVWEKAMAICFDVMRDITL